MALSDAERQERHRARRDAEVARLLEGSASFVS